MGKRMICLLMNLVFKILIVKKLMILVLFLYKSHLFLKDLKKNIGANTIISNRILIKLKNKTVKISPIINIITNIFQKIILQIMYIQKIIKIIYIQKIILKIVYIQKIILLIIYI